MTIMTADPRWIEFQIADRDTHLGLSAPAGAHERFRQAQLPYVQLICEQTPPRMRRHMIAALFDSGLSLGVIAVGFKATEAELDKVRDRPVIQPEPLDAIEALQRLSYQAYLRTDHWKKVRQAALERAEYGCTVCNSKHRLEVHHRTYDRKGCERPADVAALCAVCHARHHGQLRAA